MFIFYFLILLMLVAAALYFKFIVAWQEQAVEMNDSMSELMAGIRAQTAKKSGYNISVEHGLG
jgi:hypothetical protein